MKKLVFIDIDGTLYDYKNHCVPESAKQALRKAKENGHELFICTGRAKEMVESVYLELPISGAVFGCGAHIVFNHQVIYEAHFPLKEMKELISQFRKISPYIDMNIFKSVHNVNLETVIGYHKGDEKHSFLDDYDRE